MLVEQVETGGVGVVGGISRDWRGGGVGGISRDWRGGGVGGISRDWRGGGSWWNK